MTGPIRYRRLPGRRRGVFNGSSVWRGPDHLLLVKSRRFEEEYKRFYFRDVQAIVVAKAPRFHISTRAIAIACLWLLAYGYARTRAGLVSLSSGTLRAAFIQTPWLWVIAAGLVAAWVYVSAERSCVCRIYTAVSADRLPSVYRSWTARKFLAQVEACIQEAQGAFDPALAGQVEERQAGPDLPRPAPVSEAPQPAARRGTYVSHIFLAALFAEGLIEIWALRSTAPAINWIVLGLLLAQTAAAVSLFIQNGRGTLRSGVHKVALARLIWMFVALYANMIAVTVRMAAQPQPRVAVIDATSLVPAAGALRGLNAAVVIACGALGLVLTWRRR